MKDSDLCIGSIHSLTFGPIDDMVGDLYYTVLFPLGRSDRMYVFLETEDLVYCYQRTRGKNKLVYKVKIKGKARRVANNRPTKTGPPFASLLDRINHAINFWVSTNPMRGEHYIHDYVLEASKFAKSDLAIKREYVEYDYEPPIDTLSISLFSQGGTKPSSEAYFLEEDPFTKAKLPANSTGPDNKFYQKYGLPVTQEELSLLSR